MLLATVAAAAAPGVAADAAATSATIQLVLDKSISSSEEALVTFSIPFAAGVLHNVDELAIRRGDAEIPAYVEPGLLWQGRRHGVRSAVVQLQGVALQDGRALLSFDTRRLNSSTAPVPRLKKLAITSGYTRAGPQKAGLAYPRVFALLPPAYLAASALISPYKPGAPGDAFTRFADSHFDASAGTPFDYSKSAVADWLFDRATADYKRYMDSGRVEHLKEAFLAFRFYIRHIKQTDTPGTNCATQGRGGWFGLGPEEKCNDTKYTYVEPIKLHYALTGDDTWFEGTDSVKAQVEAMDVQTTRSNAEWGGSDCASASNQENYNFTERKCGLELLNHVNACTMYGGASCARAAATIAFLQDLQQRPKPFDLANGWVPLPGFFRHSWHKHECAACSDWNTAVGAGNRDDRRFSPWMSENIADALWQAYWQLDPTLVADHDQIGEILRRLAVAVDNFAFTTSPLGKRVPNNDLEHAPGGETWRIDCNTGPLPLYSASDIASPAALVATESADGWFSDMHSPELLTILAAGWYFERDPANRASLRKRAESIEAGFISHCTNSNDTRLRGTPRAWNWMMRSNGQRTWDWVTSNQAAPAP